MVKGSNPPTHPSKMTPGKTSNKTFYQKYGKYKPEKALAAAKAQQTADIMASNKQDTTKTPMLSYNTVKKIFRKKAQKKGGKRKTHKKMKLSERIARVSTEELLVLLGLDPNSKVESRIYLENRVLTKMKLEEIDEIELILIESAM